MSSTDCVVVLENHTQGGPVFQNNVFNGDLIINVQQPDQQKICMQALFLTDPRTDREKLKSIKGHRAKGTCEWIKNNGIYCSWLQTPSDILWISGGPGKGKTMLSMFLAEEFERIAGASPDVICAEYYFDNKDENQNSAVGLLRGLIFQILKQREDMFDKILPAWEVERERLFSNGSFEVLWKIFKAMVSDPRLGMLYCIVDGIDECRESSLDVLLQRVRTLFSEEVDPSSQFKLVVVGRQHPDFTSEHLARFMRIQLDEEAEECVKNDIIRFIEVKVSELATLFRQYPKALEEHVRETFLARAEGTFLWVGIVANEMRRYLCVEVEDALARFPLGLHELYARLILQIRPDRQTVVSEILLWVVTACRPLKLAELGAAIELCDITKRKISDVGAIRNYVEFCGPLVNIHDEEIRLVHQSAKDYLLRRESDGNEILEKFRIDESSANLLVAKKCFACFHNGSLAEGIVNVVGGDKWTTRFPLLIYAVLHWPDHMRRVANRCTADVCNISHPFYSRESPIRHAWVESYWMATKFWPLDTEEPPQLFSVLHLASHLGFAHIVRKIISKKRLRLSIHALRGADHSLLNSRDSWGWTPLHHAAAYGQLEVAEILLKHPRTLPHAKDSDGLTPLHLAANRGWEAIVRLLLSRKEVAIDSRDNYGYTPLRRAISRGRDNIVRFLLDLKDNGTYGDEVLGGCSASSLLFDAVIPGHIAVFLEIMKQAGADPDTQDSFQRTPLSWAAQKGHTKLMLLLMDDFHVTVNSKDSRGYTPLCFAAEYGKKAAVQLLLSRAHVDCNPRDSIGYTPLFLSTKNKYSTITQLLLDTGRVPVNQWTIFDETPLIKAVKWGNIQIVRLLLAQPDIVMDSKDDLGWTPLLWAAHFKHDEIASLLKSRIATLPEAVIVPAKPASVST